MYKFYANEYGVTVEVTEATPDKVRVYAGEAEFFNGTTKELSIIMQVAKPGDINPAMLQFAQWYDERYWLRVRKAK